MQAPTPTPTPTPTTSPAALLAPGPAPDRAEKLHLYGRLIGAWDLDATVHRDDGTTHHGHGTIDFFWVLEGRAIQDVWILPGVFHGTTLRIYDPGIDAWHILWSDPLRQYLRPPARPPPRPRHRAGRHQRRRRNPPLELHRNDPGQFPLARRALPRQRRHLGAASRFPRPPPHRTGHNQPDEELILGKQGHRGKSRRQSGASPQE